MESKLTLSTKNSDPGYPCEAAARKAGITVTFEIPTIKFSLSLQICARSRFVKRVVELLGEILMN